MKLTIVIPIYNEEDNLEELHERLMSVFSQCDDIEWHVILVNDGSRDKSLEMMDQMRDGDPRFSIISLSRNFGHQSAIAAGLGHAEGDAVILMDGDLQDPPEVIPQLLERWQAGAQIIRAQRRSRRERGLRRLGFELFYWFFDLISDFPIPTQSGIFGLIDRAAVIELNNLHEKNRYFPGLRSWVGFKQDVIYYDRQERSAGEPKQSFKNLIHYAMDAVFSFSYKPLRVLTGTGVIISCTGFILASVFVIKRLTGIEPAPTGFTTLVTLLLFLGGIQLMGIGLLGEYLARIYDEVKQRPLYIVDQSDFDRTRVGRKMGENRE